MRIYFTIADDKCGSGTLEVLSNNMQRWMGHVVPHAQPLRIKVYDDDTDETDPTAADSTGTKERILREFKDKWAQNLFTFHYVTEWQLTVVDGMVGIDIKLAFKFWKLPDHVWIPLVTAEQWKACPEAGIRCIMRTYSAGIYRPMNITWELEGTGRSEGKTAAIDIPQTSTLSGVMSLGSWASRRFFSIGPALPINVSAEPWSGDNVD